MDAAADAQRLATTAVDGDYLRERAVVLTDLASQLTAAPHPTPAGVTRSSVSDDGGRGLSENERKLALALREYDAALCGHAAMIARKEKFTRAEGWGLVEELRARFNVVDLIRASGQPHEPRAALSPAAPSETLDDLSAMERASFALLQSRAESYRAASPSEQEGA